MNFMQYDVIVAGSGFAGTILAERMASVSGKKVLLLERRGHLAGNMYDYVDSAGVLVHKYGPHIFRTNDEAVWNYLNRFGEFNGYMHHVLTEVDGQLIPVPFNYTSLVKSFVPEKAARLKVKLIENYGAGGTVPVSALRSNSDPELAWLGEYVFEKIYLNYTIKQWGTPPEKLDFETVTKRVPLRLSYFGGYFTQKYQGVPVDGYTKMFDKMLENPLIDARTGVDALDIVKLDPGTGKIAIDGKEFGGLFVYTGSVDELFGFKFGELPYRALEFIFKTKKTDWIQPVGTVNYPNEHKYTRITEFKHLTKQKIHGVTSYAEEYPLPFDRKAARGNEPYYPIPAGTSQECYDRYAEMAGRFKNLLLVGRLAEYRYYDMNDIVARALAVFEQIGDVENGI